MREQILGINDRTVSPVEVPEWSTTVYVRSLSLGEFVQFTKLLDNEGADNYAAVVALTACDSEGARLFTDADVPALAGKSFKALQRIATAAVEHNFGEMTEAGKD